MQIESARVKTFDLRESFDNDARSIPYVLPIRTICHNTGYDFPGPESKWSVNITSNWKFRPPQRNTDILFKDETVFAILGRLVEILDNVRHCDLTKANSDSAAFGEFNKGGGVLQFCVSYRMPL